jgi:glycosyltransferase involved in cell wall biosynthesis
MTACAELNVIAPLPMIDYVGRKLHLARGVPMQRRDESLEVFHPRWIYPPGGTPINLISLYSRLVQQVREIRKTFSFQLIDAHFGYPEGVVAAMLARKFGCPFTITLRGNEPMFAAYRYRGRCLRWAMKSASAVIAVSKPLRDFAIESGVEPNRAIVIPNGIDKHTFHPRDRDVCRARFGITDGAKTILSAGELIEAKGHHLIIRALRSLVDSGIDAKLFIAGGISSGGHPFERQIRNTIAELNLEGRVHLLGWVAPQQLSELMSAADIFAMASFAEGWPNVVNEALACGLPVIASNVGAVPELIPSKRYGSIVPARDVAALTTALKSGLEHSFDRAAIAAWGQSRSWDQVAREVIDVFQRVVAEAHVRN